MLSGQGDGIFYFSVAFLMISFISALEKLYAFVQNWHLTSVFSSFASSLSSSTPVDISARTTRSLEQLHLYSGEDSSRTSSSKFGKTFLQISSGVSPSESIAVTGGISFISSSTLSIVSSDAVGKS